MSGLSKVDRLRIRVRRLEDELKLWREWSNHLLGAELEDDRQARSALTILWQAIRAEVNGEEEE